MATFEGREPDLAPYKKVTAQGRKQDCAIFVPERAQCPIL